MHFQSKSNYSENTENVDSACENCGYCQQYCSKHNITSLNASSEQSECSENAENVDSEVEKFGCCHQYYS